MASCDTTASVRPAATTEALGTLDGPAVDLSALDVALVDAGGANLGSVRYALERLGIAPRIVRDAAGLRGADRIVLPGVGAAAQAMDCLQAQGLLDPLRASRVPLLGICLGMQLLFEASDEGDTPCLAMLPGRVRRMQARPGIRIPHMGWNALCATRGSTLLDGVTNGTQVYFVHGYAAPVDGDTVAATTHGEPFAAIVQRGRLTGMQFHPERSGPAGLRLLRNALVAA